MRRKSGVGESRFFQGTKPGFAAIGYCYFEAMTLETDLDGRADQGIVIDDENACHVSSRRQNMYLQPSPCRPSVARFAVI